MLLRMLLQYSRERITSGGLVNARSFPPSEVDSEEKSTKMQTLGGSLQEKAASSA